MADSFGVVSIQESTLDCQGKTLPHWKSLTISTSHVIDSAKIDLVKSIPADVATLAESASGGTQMSNDQDHSQEGQKDPTVDSIPGSDPDELGSDEIIELTDVVGEGKDPLGSDADAPRLLDEEEPDYDPIKHPEDITAEGLEPLSFSAEKTESAEMEEAFPGDDFSAMESSDFKFESSSAFEAADTEPFPEQSQENLDDVLAGLEKDASAFEKPENILADLEKDEPDAEEHQIEQAEEFSSGYEEPDEGEKPMDVLADPAVATHDIPGISEEKMRELLTEIIQETVDKAVRETVSEVAEKVIQEAIDALKQSIASSEP